MGSNFNSNFMARNSAFNPYRMMRRESGFPNQIGSGNAIARSLYCGMKPIACWDCEQINDLPTGGVFNLEFSPEGSLLVAACEKKCIQIFDPLTHHRIFCLHGAHSDCVNCVKFLDARMFATCSDDATIALWDIRNLKKKICSLLGHSNWVKNIEFSVKDKLLVTSGLDGSIYTWDINTYTENSVVHHRVFHASGLMRCRLTPGARQMVMCTTGGLLIIIHNLNLSTLAKDLHGFKPNLYRLMQMSKQLIPVAAVHDHLFDDRRENQVEFVSDFPERNDAKVVSALQIHPQGWTALSRNISQDDCSEWTCIHDIQPRETARSKGTRDIISASRRLFMARQRYNRMYSRVVRVGRHDGEDTGAEPNERERVNPGPPPAPTQQRPASTSTANASIIQNDVWEASITIKQQRVVHDMYIRGQVGRNFNMQRIMGINTGITPPSAPAATAAAATATTATQAFLRESPLTPKPVNTGSMSPSTSGQTPRPSPAAEASSYTQQNIRQNRERLLYYIEETNSGKGFIKELCYSADGRLVCSPFGHGMRLLALDENCSELPHCINESRGPTPMVKVGQTMGIHQDLVVSSKFSTRHHLLVTGCLEGKIVWYEPFSGESLY